MFCRKCGKYLPNDAMFCTECGSVVKSGYQPGVSDDLAKVDMKEAIRLFFSRYAEFSGRSRRSEFWYAQLFVYLVELGLALLFPSLGWIWTVAVFVPSLAVTIRRLHDIGKSGWSYLVFLIPVVGAILLLIWFCKDSDEANRWGDNPKV